jgi:hypothetical protein
MKKIISLLHCKTETFFMSLSTYKTGFLNALCVCLNVAISFIFSVFANPVYEDPLAGLPVGIRLITLILIAPIVETILIQKFLFNVFLKYINSGKLLAILLSATIFGLAHHYSVANIFKAFLAGLLYGLLYVSLEYKNKNPVLYVAIAHAIFNSIGIIVNSFQGQ